MKNLTYIANSTNRANNQGLRTVAKEATDSVHRFHMGMENYAPTPLVSLPARAKELGLAQILVKDESARFGLNAFKGLGGSYAIGKYLCERLEIPVDEESFKKLASPEA